MVKCFLEELHSIQITNTYFPASYAGSEQGIDGISLLAFRLLLLFYFMSCSNSVNLRLFCLTNNKMTFPHMWASATIPHKDTTACTVLAGVLWAFSQSEELHQSLMHSQWGPLQQQAFVSHWKQIDLFVCCAHASPSSPRPSLSSICLTWWNMLIRQPLLR